MEGSRDFRADTEDLSDSSVPWPPPLSPEETGAAQRQRVTEQVRGPRSPAPCGQLGAHSPEPGTGVTRKQHAHSIGDGQGQGMPGQALAQVPFQPPAQPPAHTCSAADPLLSPQHLALHPPFTRCQPESHVLGDISPVCSSPRHGASCQTLCGQGAGEEQDRCRPHLWSSGGGAQHPRLGRGGTVLQGMGGGLGSEARAARPGRFSRRDLPSPHEGLGTPSSISSFGEQTVLSAGLHWGLSAGTSLPAGQRLNTSLLVRTEAPGV